MVPPARLPPLGDPAPRHGRQPLRRKLNDVGSLRFEGRRVDARDGDTVAAALFRHGVRTFNRSLKSHRRRGLYCGTGDCANCLVTVDGLPGERACVTEARDGMRVERETGWPGTERDALAITDHLHWAMPVGFYYKMFVRPRWVWGLAEKVIRRATGTGTLPAVAAIAKPTRFVRVDVLVIGGGVAGLAAAAAPRPTVGCSSPTRDGSAPPCRTRRPARRSIASPPRRARRASRSLERHAAIGIYEGPSVPLVGPEELVEVEAARVIVATGALEAHGVFPGNDLPGVWLGARRRTPGRPRRRARRSCGGRRQYRGRVRERGGVARGRGGGRRGPRARDRGSRIQERHLGHGADRGGPPRVRVRRARALARMGAARHAAADEPRSRGCRSRRRGAARLHPRGGGGEWPRGGVGRTRRAAHRRDVAHPRGGRLRLRVRGRRRARARGGLGRGLDRLGDPQALHHRDDGTLPGRPVLTSPRGVHRGQGRGAEGPGSHDRPPAGARAASGRSDRRRARGDRASDGAARAPRRARRADRPLGRRGCARPTTAMCPRRSARSANASRSWTSRRSGSSWSPGATRGRCSTGCSRSTSARWRAVGPGICWRSTRPAT